MNARQGLRYHLQDAVTVRDPLTMQEVPADGETIGEIMFRGTTMMTGYLKTRAETRKRFAVAGFTPGTWRLLIRTAMSGSRTAARTSSFRAARIFQASKLKMCCIAIQRYSRPPSLRSRTFVGGRRLALSSS